MEAKYEKAIELLKTTSFCPSTIASACDIPSEILHDATDGCNYDEWMGSCRFCREDALEEMLRKIQ